MPSLGHVVVGLAAGRLHAGADRPRLAPTLLLTALATFPDLDVLARPLGAAPGSPWMHRGALHSLAAAAVAGVVVALLAGGLGRSRWRLAFTAALVAAGHGLLDMFTSGGRGVMLLWPATTERFLAALHVVSAAPMGLRLASARGFEVMAREAILFSPLLVYALWPARRAAEPRRVLRTAAVNAGGGDRALPAPLRARPDRSGLGPR
jgi:inner membrane protein